MWLAQTNDRFHTREMEKSIITDRLVMKSPTQNTEVVIDLDRIKLLIRNHMYKWMKDKGTSTISELESEWNWAFEPMESIPESDINTIISTITIEELKTVLQEISTKKVSGPLRITNEMFKNTGPQAKKYLLSLMNKVLHTGTMLADWISSYISLFLKLRDWEGSLDLICPIILIETSL